MGPAPDAGRSRRSSDDATALAPGRASELASADLAALQSVLLHDAPVAIYTVDLHGVVLSWNPAAEELFGWVADEIIGRPVPFMPEEEHDNGRKLFHRLLKGGARGGLEYRPVRKDGTRIHAHTSASLVRDGAGKPVAVLAFAVDVTAKRRAAEAVAQAEHRWRTLLESTSDTVTFTDAEGNIKQTTGEFTDVLGYPGEWWYDRAGWDLIHPDDQSRAFDAFMSVVENPGQTFHDVFRTRHNDGHWELIEYTAVNRLDDPLVEAIVVTTRNVTEVKLAERLLADEAGILELIARTAPLSDILSAIAHMVEYHTGGDAGIFLLAPDGKSLVTGAAPSLPVQMLEASHHDAVPPSSARVIESRQTVVIEDLGAVDTDSARILVEHGYRSGWSVPIIDTQHQEVFGTITVVYQGTRTPSPREHDVVGVASHLAGIAIERDHAHRELEHRARHDQLTGLPNRWAIIEHLELALQRRKHRHGVAVLVVDLDRFKLVNDSLGHHGGDAVLVAFGERLRSIVPTDAFVGHFGTDEFVVVVEDIDQLDDLLHVASRLDLALTEPFIIDDGKSVSTQEIFLSASIGAAVAGADDVATELLQHADAAMYRAKGRGRDRLEVYDQGMQDLAAEQLRVDRELRQAVERAQLDLFYQPKIDLTSGGIIGVEALLRWDHPTRGIVEPAEFIGVAEETGLIVRIGKWVIDEAVRQARSWLDRLPSVERLTVAVNLSARQLTSPGLVSTVARVLDRYGWPADDLVLELTESILIDDAETALGVVRQLKALGVKLAIDDFGTGFSSLSYLHRFPVDIVKVDRSFVTSLQENGEGSAIAAAVVHMARALGLITAAEGVEEPAQLVGLRALGCDWAQGFLFARALPADDITALLAARPTW